MSSVELRALTKTFDGTVAVDGVDAQIRQGELLALLGPSGCGKTTTLRMLAGIVLPDSGRVLFGERDVTTLPPESRDVGLVFQHYALFPHKTVADNLAFGLRMRGQRADRFRGPVEAMLERLHLSHLGGRLPAELSGGQRQRVALGRALVTRPSVLLLDEPLSNLDANLREEMRFYIRDLVTEFGITTVYVTHDQAEALAMADRVAVMMDGSIAQLASPQQIYNEPATRRVASFVGVANLLAGQATDDDGDLVTVSGPWGVTRGRRAAPLVAGSAAAVSVRPEDITLSPRPGTDSASAGTAGAGAGAAADGVRAVGAAGSAAATGELRPDGPGGVTVADGVIEQAAYLGNTVDYRVRVAGITVRVQGDPRRQLVPGDGVRVEFPADRAWVVPDDDGAARAGSNDDATTRASLDAPPAVAERA